MKLIQGRLAALSAVSVLFGLAGAHAAPAPSADPAALEAAKSGRADALALLKALVDVDSGTGDASGGQRILEILKPRLSAIGAEVSEVPAEAPGLPPALTAVLHGDGRGRVLLIAHLDTVFPPGTVQTRGFSISGDRAYGPGVGDEKAGVAAAVTVLTALHRLKVHDFGTITLLIDNSEERGSPGATRLIRRLSAASDVELNLEPGDPPDAVTVWRKGSASIRIAVQGRAAHAGMAPQDGRNAAVELIHQIDALHGRFPTSGPETTVNLTVLKAGERNNIIPDAAEGTLNVRFRTMGAFDQVLAAVRAGALKVEVAGTHVSVAFDPAFPPLAQTPAVTALALRAQGFYRELGRDLALSGNGGASESALAQSVGVPALDGLGFVGGDFHTDHEWIDLASVTPRLYLLMRLIMDLGARPPVGGGG